MPAELYWVEGPWPGRLAIAPRPRGGDWLADEVLGWQRSGIDAVVSLLTSEESTELDLGDEAAACGVAGLAFLAFPVNDRGVPVSRAEFIRLILDLKGRLTAGQTVLVHCRQGIGRAALVAIGLLVAEGIGVAAAAERVGKSRGRVVPETPEQRQWIETQAKAPFTQAA